MNLFSNIPNGQAIVRKAKGIYSQLPLYHREQDIYIAVGSSYIRICSKFGDYYTCSHPDYQVLELDGGNLTLNKNDAPQYLPKSGWKD